jgi:general secretion pathway protein H
MVREAGFALIEAVCVLAIVGLLALLVLPAFPYATTQARLAGLAVDIAALLKGDRNAAIHSHAIVSALVDVDRRVVRSGSHPVTVEVPADVAFSALVARRCSGRMIHATVDFFPSGESCGGVIALSRQGVGYQIRVNWLTGGVEIVPIGKI